MTSKLTRERLAEIAQFGFSSAITPANDFEIKELARLALAAMDSKPVAIIDLANLDYLLSGADADVWPPEREEMGDVFLYRHPQPAPVVPDGYVMVPKEMTDEIGEAIAMQANCCGGIALDIYDAMLAAAPQSPGSEPATVPGKWIPVSERMPDENAEQQVLACFKGGDISALYYSDGRWDDAYGIVPIRQDVTHWMPLPAAPQEAIDELIPLVSRNEQEVK